MTKLLLCWMLLVLSTVLRGGEAHAFNTEWIPQKPEMLTYRSTAKQGDGLYQVSVSRVAGDIELYMNIITPGFTKTVWGKMTADMRPRESRCRIVINEQISMTTDCSYGAGSMHVATVMLPYNQMAENTLQCPSLVLDYSQSPLLARTLALKPGAEFKFDSLDPQKNVVSALSLRVVATETIQNIECYKIEGHDYEGANIFWIERGGHHRVLRIEQPDTGRVTVLIP